MLATPFGVAVIPDMPSVSRDMIGNPEGKINSFWIPAFAGMTESEVG